MPSSGGVDRVRDVLFQLSLIDGRIRGGVDNDVTFDPCNGALDSARNHQIELRPSNGGNRDAGAWPALGERPRNLTVGSDTENAHARILVEITWQIGERRVPRVLLGQDRLTGVDRPLDAESRIVPGDAVVVLRGIVIGYFVDDLGIRLERAEAVRKADRDKNLRAVLGG